MNILSFRNSIQAHTLALLFFFSCFTFVSAQESDTTPPTYQEDNSSQTFLVADVNLYNCTLTQNDRIVEISCDVTNNLDTRTDIRTTVALVNKKTQQIYGSKTYPETLTVHKGETIKKTFEYEIPPFLSGDFEVWVSLNTVESLPLDLKNAGSIEVQVVNDEYIEIDESHCALKIGEEKTLYTLMQGVDFDANEKVTVNCPVRNHSSKSTFNVRPVFVTHYRTDAGDVVKDTADQQPVITLAPSERKNISFVLPKALAPQAYDTLFALATAEGKVVSDTIKVHYVLRGISATISLLSLDKDYYGAGDKAVVKFLWTGSADSFYDSRKGATDEKAEASKLTLTNESGEVCASPQEVPAPKSDIDKAKPNEIAMDIFRECVNPQITLRVLDASRNMIAEKSIQLESSKKEEPVSVANQEESITKTPLTGLMENSSNIILFVSSLLLAVMLLMMYIRKRKERNVI